MVVVWTAASALAAPAGEGNAYDKAYAAAFVLLMVVIALNFAVELIARERRSSRWS